MRSAPVARRPRRRTPRARVPVLSALLGACALAALALPARAADLEPGEVRKGQGRFEFEESVLPNGLRVISLEDHSTPIVAVQLWYHVGSKDEQVDRQGFAHMFEHMMFRGTDRLGPKSHFEYISRTGGNANAYTSFDQTVYVQEVPSNQLDMVLWLEAERMAGLKIDEGGFATERKVVEEERRMGLNQPYGRVFEQLLGELFRKHPYRWTPIGKIEHLRAATADDIQQFWDTYYVPNNATLVVVGDVTHAEVRRLARERFGWIPRCPEPPRVTVKEDTAPGLRRIDIDEESGPAPVAGVVFHTVPMGHPDELALEMCMEILGGGESSRLYVELVRRKDVAEIAGAGAVTFEQAGLALAGGLALPFKGDVDDIIEATWAEIEALKADGVSEEDLAKVRNAKERASVTESMTCESKASALGTAAMLQGDAQLVNTRLERVRSVTTADIQRVARTYLVKDRAAEVRIEPSLKGMLSTALSLAGNTSDKADEAAAEQAEVEGGKRALAGGPKAKAERPESMGETPPVAPPLDVDIDISAQTHVLENGLRVVLVENHEVPFVSASLRLAAGSFTEDPEAPGTAAMAASLVTKGTYARDAEAMAAELEKHAISLGADAGHDGASVEASCVTAQLERALRLMAEVVMVPAFDEEEFATLRDQTATGMSIEEKSPAAVADRAFQRALWGDDHPYGRPAAGTSDDLAELDPEGLREWWETFVRPETAVLYLAGDVDPEESLALATRYFGDWEAWGDEIERPLPTMTPPRERKITLVDRPGSVQSEIRAGHEGITRRHPLHAPGVIITQIFGGSFGSRLNDVIRVQKGLTYGARGGLRSRRFGGEMAISTFTKTPRTAETVRAVLDEVQRMVDEPPTERELTDAVSYLAGSFAGSLETPQSVAGRLWTLELHDLPADYWNTYLARINAASSDSVAEAAAQLLDPSRLIMVVVGDAEAVQEELEEIAEVEVIKSRG